MLLSAEKNKNASRADAFFAVSALLGPPDFDMPARKIPKIALGAEKRGSEKRPEKRPEKKKRVGALVCVMCRASGRGGRVNPPKGNCNKDATKIQTCV